jgi:hypothetical protein
MDVQFLSLNHIRMIGKVFEQLNRDPQLRNKLLGEGDKIHSNVQQIVLSMKAMDADMVTRINTLDNHRKRLRGD